MNDFKRADKWIHQLILIVFTLWIGVVLLGAIQQPHLLVNRTTKVTTYVMLMALTIGVILIKSVNARKFMNLIFVKKQYWTLSILTIATITWQYLIVINAHTPIGFDVNSIYQGLTDPISSYLYFSQYPNNLFVLFFLRTILDIFSLPSTWEWLSLISMVSVDISVIMNCITVKKIDHSKFVIAWYLQLIWLMVFPMILVPYTDTLVLPFVSGIIMAYVYLRRQSNISWKIILWSMVFAIMMIGAYLMKPSSIVPVIAIISIELCDFILNKKGNNQWWHAVIVVGIIVSMSVGLVKNYHAFVQKQQYITVISGKEQPLIHWIGMGMSGGGGYNNVDVDKTFLMKTKIEREDYAKNIIHERLHQMGITGYARFLTIKNYNNTADGSFGWLLEGNFIDAKTQPGFKGKIQSFFYPDGNHLGDFYWIAQVVWIIALAIIVLGYDLRNRFATILRLGIIGGLLFLLIFEGGRSRYLIQFLPLFVLLASLSFHGAIFRIKLIFDALDRAVSDKLPSK